jgi:excinuclease ABC subunit B
VKAIDDASLSVYGLDYQTPQVLEEQESYLTQTDIDTRIEELHKQMRQAAANLDFERAATLRDKIKGLKARELGFAAVRPSRS